ADKFTFGPRTTVEIRARASTMTGTWQSLWALPHNRQCPPEIDIANLRGKCPRSVHASIYDGCMTSPNCEEGTPGTKNEHSVSYSIDSIGNWHNYRWDWDYGCVSAYCDGVLKNSYCDPTR